MSRRAFAAKRDLLVIAALLVLSLGGWGVYHMLAPKTGAYAEIVVDGRIVTTVSLADDQIFSVEERPQIRFQVRDGHCAFVASDCPDKVCVHTGFLGTPGYSAACLPNRTVLRIRSEDGGNVDMVAR